MSELVRVRADQRMIASVDEGLARLRETLQSEAPDSLALHELHVLTMPSRELLPFNDSN